MNLREVNDDILKNWIIYREDDLCCNLTKEDKKHMICFEEIAENILRNVPKENKKYVQRQLERLDDNYMDYITYWNEKYYRNGFCDGIELVNGCFEE